MSLLLLCALIYFALRFINAASNAQNTNTGGHTYSRTYTYGQSRRQNFITALLVLIAEVMKADGQVKKVELDFVKRQLVSLLGYDDARFALLQLRDILKQQQNLYEVISLVRVNVDYDTKLTILHILYGIAKADGVVTDTESQLIMRIGLGIGLSQQDTESIINAFSAGTNIDAAYKTLAITPDASDDEVKKAYRTMAMKYHPDRVATLGKEVMEQAEIKFRQVQEAYDKIKQARNMK